MAGGGPRPTFASVNRSESNPADGGGDGIGVTGVIESACRPRVLNDLNPTKIIPNASVISHRRDLDITPAIGAFYSGQEAHVH